MRLPTPEDIRNPNCEWQCKPEPDPEPDPEPEPKVKLLNAFATFQGGPPDGIPSQSHGDGVSNHAAGLAGAAVPPSDTWAPSGPGGIPEEAVWEEGIDGPIPAWGMNSLAASGAAATNLWGSLAVSGVSCNTTQDLSQSCKL